MPDELLTAPEAAPLTPAAAELIPFAHHKDWLDLTNVEREQLKELLNVLTSVKDDPRGVTAALRAHALANNGRQGWAFESLRRKYYALAGAKWDWRALRKKHKHETKLPAAFVDHLRTMVLREHRSRKQAIEKIRAAWRDGKEVPGYGTFYQWFAGEWPELDAPRGFTGDYPDSWSQSNLYLHMPPPAQHALATRGYAAADDQMPHVIRDTSTLRPMEMIVFDDFECDVRAIFNRRVVRVRGVLAIDVATRRKLAVGFKPFTEDDEGKRQSITRADVQFLIKGIFMRYGTPANYPVTLLVENAAAAISSDLEAALAIYFHGQVRVQRTGILEHRTLANGFVEKGGKPKEKGWIESRFNLMHNFAGSLPGQKGARYDLAPATDEGRVAYCEQLLNADLSDEQLAQLKMPIDGFDNLIRAYERIFDLIDQRTNHKMLGFDKVKEWSRGPGDPWHPMSEFTTLSDVEQFQVEINTRPESSLERWEKLATGVRFMPVPEFTIALLAYTPKKIQIRNRKAVFSHAKQDYVYLDTEGCLKALPEGVKLLGYFDEGAPGRLYVTDLQGAAIGILRHNAPANIKDPEAIGEAAAIVKEFFHSQVQKPVRELLAGDDAKLLAERTHNAAKLIEFGKPLPLSRQLADDKVTTTPTERFGGAAAIAAGVGATVQAQADETRRRRPARAPKHDLGDLVGETGTAADDDSGLDRLM